MNTYQFKIQNIKNKNAVTILSNNTKEETENCFNMILNEIRDGQN